MNLFQHESTLDWNRVSLVERSSTYDPVVVGLKICVWLLLQSARYHLSYWNTNLGCLFVSVERHSDVQDVSYELTMPFLWSNMLRRCNITVKKLAGFYRHTGMTTCILPTRIFYQSSKTFIKSKQLRNKIQSTSLTTSKTQQEGMAQLY